ncbi:unnamed protein product [Heligmosomoides polygyrus]|uniref:Uncharacterized protein n=1 Tax=Heligmosomoides polygyrus TaxID=6339 RepID=A0A183FER7_HELPZ|nr:unnamed protein product [Heligmosomoides polygyrus]
MSRKRGGAGDKNAGELPVPVAPTAALSAKAIERDRATGTPPCSLPPMSTRATRTTTNSLEALLSDGQGERESSMSMCSLSTYECDANNVWSLEL